METQKLYRKIVYVIGVERDTIYLAPSPKQWEIGFWKGIYLIKSENGT